MDAVSSTRTGFLVFAERTIGISVADLFWNREKTGDCFIPFVLIQMFTYMAWQE